MSTSGNTSYEATRDSLIAAAMRKCGALSKGESPDSEDLTNGTEALNGIVTQLYWLKNSHTVFHMNN